MDYVITNSNKTIYIRLNENGLPVTCAKDKMQRFEYSKAKNIFNHLPRTMKKLHFRVEAIPEIKSRQDLVNMNESIIKDDSVTTEKKKEVIENANYTVCENILKWIDKFSVCDDIITEAIHRKEKLKEELSVVDKKLVDELHIIELEGKKNACQGYKEYAQIRVILKKRRDIKDELLIVSSVLSDNYSKLSKEYIRKSVSGLKTRRYSMRITDEDVETT